MRAIIVAGGTVKNPEIIKGFANENSIIIACDKGLNYIHKAGLMPDVILGDFDSVDKNILDYYKNKAKDVFAYPVKKDNTDTELGIFAAEDKGADDIVLIGASGTRLDHIIANIQILLPLLKKGIRARLVDENNIVELVSHRLVIENKKGSYISLLPFTETVEGLTTQGLEYALDNKDITVGTSLTVSNVVIADRAEVTLKKGVIISIIAKD